ncbi:MAG: hypothetical protein HSCHL_0391 [Hydrogenibacillus schlegelii]|uniref:Uncharacterized protein n=1 Tax=Hydrogenibacillus schlegelii TaxID=1484 RepID=A0A2T5G3J2_HYDSH|nr:MAG: hypothetical protein HSCHL_0391 [Hydrogenibacillus schlegelii]
MRRASSHTASGVLRRRSELGILEGQHRFAGIPKRAREGRVKVR